jgi:hypothetical protein
VLSAGQETWREFIQQHPISAFYQVRSLPCGCRYGAHALVQHLWRHNRWLLLKTLAGTYVMPFVTEMLPFYLAPAYRLGHLCLFVGSI